MKTKLLKILTVLSAFPLIGCKRIVVNNSNNDSNSDISNKDTSTDDTSTNKQTEHTYSSTWTYDGSKHWHSCIDEGYENLKKDEEEHNFVEDTSKKIEPTYETKGAKYFTCSICGYEKNEPIEKLEHNYSSTWSYDGSKHWHSCIDEGYENLKKDEEEHNFVEDTSKKIEPTYETKGAKYFTCSICGYEKNEPIDKLEHNYSTTWSSDGTNHWHACIDEGYENLKKDEEEHNFTEDESKKVEPTFENNGKLVEVCSICNFEKETIVPMLEHNYSNEWESNENYHWHDCSDQGYETINSEHIAHNYELVDDSLVCKDCSYVSNLISKLNSDGASYSITGIKNNTSIDEILIPETINDKPVTCLGDCLFTLYTSLASIIIPNTVTTIGQNTFNGCTFLTSITLPNSLISIGNDAFTDCTSLTSITIPNSVTSIGDWAFSGCSSISTIYIPKNVISLGNWVFSNCTSLTSITVDETNPNYESINNCIIEKSTNTLIVGCHSSIIPNSVVAIGDYAFHSCTSLTSLVIPNNVTSIGDQAFYKCTSLTSINIPNSVISIGEHAFSTCSSLTSIVIPNSVTSIGNSPFINCPTLTSITVEENNPIYLSINNCIIERNSNTLIAGCVSSIIPNSVVAIGNHAFFSCTNLTSIVIPDSVTSIGEKAFSSCFALTSVIIPYSVTTINELVFYRCSNLTHVYYTGTQAQWQSIKTLYLNPNLKSNIIYYYSETQPTESGNYWHYDSDGVTPIDW